MSKTLIISALALVAGALVGVALAGRKAATPATPAA